MRLLVDLRVRTARRARRRPPWVLLLVHAHSRLPSARASVGPRPPPNQRKQQILAGAAGVFTGTDIKHEAQFGGSLGQQLRQTSVMDFAGAAGAS